MSSEKLKNTSTHKMGLIALTLVTASNMMGSGVFMLPTNLGALGYISIWGWVFTIVGVLSLALVFAKTSILTPRTGGIVAYANDAFGPFIGFQTTVCYWISAWVGQVALLVAGIGYLSFFFPQLKNPVIGCTVSIILIWAFTFLSTFGAKVGSRAQSFTAICGLVVVLGTGILGWFWFNPQMFTAVYNGTGKGDFSAIMSAASIALWGFLGVESAVVSTGQVKNPEYTVPRATVLGLLLAAICYVGSCTVIMGLVPHKVLMHSAAPFADAVSYMFGNRAGQITSILSIIACFGSIPGWIILQSEAPRAGAEHGLFPQFFAEMNKNEVPVKNIVFTTILISLVLVLTASPDLANQFQIVILMSVFASLLPYMYAIISLPIIMASKKLNKSREFMFYSVLTIIAMIYCLFALLGSGSGSIFWGVVMMSVTIPLYSFVSVSKSKKGENALFIKE